MQRRLSPVASVFAGVVALAVSGQAAAQIVVQNLAYSFVDARASNLVTTSSTSYTALPSMSVSVVAVPPTLVRFCGYGNLSGAGNGVVSVRPMLDGAVAGNGVQIFVNELTRRTACWTWTLDGFAPGNHTLRLEWRTSDAASPAVIQDRNLTLEGIVAQQSAAAAD
ncbi:MAG: hypothetical protein H6983_15900 [Ectothiorhodospiraceae bacterium]|nr:hypothetical protein [Chromatiales bacterium]MCP5155655.1 hypothetical protein [Ectothiorhodospiraceae bacterium]